MRWLQSLPLLIGAASALTPAQWRSQSIYQVITDRFALANGSTTQACGWGNYCGGTWQGIINKLDYIQGMGFTAIWISPIVKNIASSPYGEPYHGYWAQDIYALNSKFGTAADLKALSAALHARGMYLMVDVVANHYAWNGSPSTVNYATFNPFNDVKYYHPYCPIDYNNATSREICWMGDTLVPLPDLRTEDAAVQTGFQTWIRQLVSNYSIDGLRLDSAQQTNQGFWPGFMNASGIYAVGEVLNGDPNVVCPWQNYISAALNYPAYFWMLRAFFNTAATMTELATQFVTLNNTCKDTTLLGNFLENHDQPRFPSITKDAGLTKNAIAYTVFNDGIPIIYYGQEQGFSGKTDPYNREPFWTSAYNTKAPLYTFIGALNRARNLAVRKDSNYAASKSTIVYADSKTFVTRKGWANSGLISLFTNRGDGASATVTLTAAKTGIKAKTQFTDLLTCAVFTADASGNLAVTISSGLPRALYLTSALTGSDTCAYTNTGATTSVHTTSTTSTKSTTSSSKTSTTSSKTSTVPSALASCGGMANSATYNAANGQKFLVECGIDHEGGNLSLTIVSNDAAGFKKCIEACATNAACVDVSLSGSLCWLKKSVGSNVYNNSILGAKLIGAKPVTTSSTLATSTKATTTGRASTTTTACYAYPTVAVQFLQNTTTQWLENVIVVGSIPELGTWSPANAFNLTTYGNTYPIWNGTVRIAAGTSFQYKFVKVNSTSQAVTWEKDPNRSYTVPRSCASTVAINGQWQA